MSDNCCECEYCSNQGEVYDCWALQKIATLEAIVEKFTSANTGSPKFPTLVECERWYVKEKCGFEHITELEKKSFAKYAIIYVGNFGRVPKHVVRNIFGFLIYSFSAHKTVFLPGKQNEEEKRMKEYCKIHTVYKRDPATKHKIQRITATICKPFGTFGRAERQIVANVVRNTKPSLYYRCSLKE